MFHALYQASTFGRTTSTRALSGECGSETRTRRAASSRHSVASIRDLEGTSRSRKVFLFSSLPNSQREPVRTGYADVHCPQRREANICYYVCNGSKAGVRVLQTPTCADPERRKGSPPRPYVLVRRRNAFPRPSQDLRPLGRRRARRRELQARKVRRIWRPR